MPDSTLRFLLRVTLPLIQDGLSDFNMSLWIEEEVYPDDQHFLNLQEYLARKDLIVNHYQSVVFKLISNTEAADAQFMKFLCRACIFLRKVQIQQIAGKSWSLPW
jgi:hypothetical protein